MQLSPLGQCRCYTQTSQTVSGESPLEWLAWNHSQACAASSLNTNYLCSLPLLQIVSTLLSWLVSVYLHLHLLSSSTHLSLLFSLPMVSITWGPALITMPRPSFPEFYPQYSSPFSLHISFQKLSKWNDNDNNHNKTRKHWSVSQIQFIKYTFFHQYIDDPFLK